MLHARLDTLITAASQVRQLVCVHRAIAGMFSAFSEFSAKRQLTVDCSTYYPPNQCCAYTGSGLDCVNITDL